MNLHTFREHTLPARRNNITLGGEKTNFLIDICNNKQIDKRTKLKILDELESKQKHNDSCPPLEVYIQSCRNREQKSIQFNNNKEVETFRKIQKKKNVSCEASDILNRLHKPKLERNDSAKIDRIIHQLDSKIYRRNSIKDLNNHIDCQLKQSIHSVTSQQKKILSIEVERIKEEAKKKIIESDYPEVNFNDLIKIIKQETAKKIDEAVDSITQNRKNIYKLAKLEIQSYFSKVKERSNRTPNTQTTENSEKRQKTQGTPCFEETSNPKHRQIREFCLDNSKDRSQVQNTVVFTLGDEAVIEKFETIANQDTAQSKMMNTKQKAKQNSISQFDTFATKKTSNKTKLIKDRIIFGAGKQVKINQFNIN